MTFITLKLLWIGKSFRVEILFTLSHQLLQPKKFNLRDRWLFQHSRGGGWMAFGCSTASWLLSFSNWLKIATMIMTMNNWPWLSCALFSCCMMHGNQKSKLNLHSKTSQEGKTALTSQFWTVMSLSNAITGIICFTWRGRYSVIFPNNHLSQTWRS